MGIRRTEFVNECPVQSTIEWWVDVVMEKKWRSWCREAAEVGKVRERAQQKQEQSSATSAVKR